MSFVRRLSPDVCVDALENLACLVSETSHVLRMAQALIDALVEIAHAPDAIAPMVRWLSSKNDVDAALRLLRASAANASHPVQLTHIKAPFEAAVSHNDARRAIEALELVVGARGTARSPRDAMERGMWNSVLRAVCASSGELEQALAIVAERRLEPDSAMLNAMLSGFWRVRRDSGAVFATVAALQERWGVKLDGTSCRYVLHALCAERRWSAAREFIARMESEHGVRATPETLEVLVKALAECGDWRTVDDVRRQFGSELFRGRCYDATLSRSAADNDLERVVAEVRDMLHTGHVPRAETAAAVLDRFLAEGDNTTAYRLARTLFADKSSRDWADQSLVCSLVRIFAATRQYELLERVLSLEPSARRCVTLAEHELALRSLADAGDGEHLLRLFARTITTHRPRVTTFNELISALCRTGQREVALQHVLETMMPRAAVRPNGRTFAILALSFVKDAHDTDAALELLRSRMHEAGVQLSTAECEWLVHELNDLGHVELAKSVLALTTATATRTNNNNSNNATTNTARSRQPSDKRPHTATKPEPAALSSWDAPLLDANLDVLLREAKLRHAIDLATEHVARLGVTPGIERVLREAALQYDYEGFDRVRKSIEACATPPSPASSTLLCELWMQVVLHRITHAAHDADSAAAATSAIHILEHLATDKAAAVDSYRVDKVLVSVAQRGHEAQLLALFDVLVQRRLPYSRAAANDVVELLCRRAAAATEAPRQSEALALVRRVLALMHQSPVVRPNATSYNRVFDVCSLHNDPASAHSLLLEMCAAGVNPDRHTCATVFSLFLRDGSLSVRQIFELLHASGLTPTVAAYNFLIKLLGEQRLFDEALAVLEHEMPSAGVQPTVASYHALLRAYVPNSLREALELVRSMMSDQCAVKPDRETFRLLAKAAIAAQDRHMVDYIADELMPAAGLVADARFVALQQRAAFLESRAWKVDTIQTDHVPQSE